MSKLTRYEQETVINYNRLEKNVKIYTSIPNDIAKLDMLAEKYPNHYKLISEDSVSKTYECTTKKLIKFVQPRILTEEQKTVLRARFAKYRRV